MQSLNDEFDIRLFSHLIQTVLCCRLSKYKNIDKQISLTINKLQTTGHDDWVDLNFGIQMLSKLHEGSNFFVQHMIQKHFLLYDAAKYSIYLEIFTLHNKSQQQKKGGKSGKNQLIQKWVFRKEKDKKRFHSTQQTLKTQTDLIFKVLTFIKAQNQSQNQANGKNLEINNNATTTKGYQLVIKSHCPKKRKKLYHVLHLEKKISQLQFHTKSLKSSLLQLPNFWQKSIHFDCRNEFFVGCYFYKPIKNQINKIETVDYAVLKQADRKLSSETKAEQKESTCSFKFSLENFSFRRSRNKKLKQSSDVQLIRKTSEQISNIHRPRYQSIYESKDEQMNIFILSPRKLSQEQSPKMRHLEQKPLQFEITEHKGISEEVIEQFVLERDELMSNGSSEGFEMLQENDQLDSINEEKSVMKEFEKAQQQATRRQKQMLKEVNQIENELIVHLKSIDDGWLLSV